MPTIRVTCCCNDKNQFHSPLAGGGLAIFLAMASMTFALDPLGIQKIDYLDNIPATNRFIYEPYEENVLPLLEYDLTTNPVTDVLAVAYERGTNISVTFTFVNPNGIAVVNGTFTFSNPQFERFSDLGNYITLGGGTSSSISIAAYGTATKTVTFTGLPNYVTKGWLRGEIDITSNQGIGFSMAGPTNLEWVYLTFDMPIELMEIPWLEVLDDSCYFADGQDTEAEVAHKLTTGLYFGSRFYYNGSGNWWLQTEGEEDYPGWFYLGAFLDSEMPRYGDCRDVSCYNNICFMSQGVESELKIAWTGDTNTAYDPPYVYQFVTNPIIAVGHGGGFTPTTWNYHQVVEKDGYIYDACERQQYDPYGFTTSDPPSPYSWPDYWQNQVFSNFYGLVSHHEDDSGPAICPYSLDPSVVGVYPFADFQDPVIGGLL